MNDDNIYRNKNVCSLRIAARSLLGEITNHNVGNRTDILDIRRHAEELKTMIFAIDREELSRKSDVRWVINAMLTSCSDTIAANHLHMALKVMEHAKSANPSKMKGAKWVEMD